MRRREVTLDPEVAADLAALDRALQTGTGADEDLGAIVRETRAGRAEPDPAFVASLGQRVAEGFPAAGSSAPARRRPQWLRLPPLGRLLPAGGAVAAIVVLVVVVASGMQSSGGDDASSSGSSGSVASAPGAASAARGTVESQAAPEAAAGAAADSSASVAPQAKQAVPAAPAAGDEAVSGTRRVQRDAQMSLSAPRDRVPAVSDAISQAIVALGGYVANVQVSASGASASASLVLRVPSAKLDDALSRLGRLARVTGLSRSATDITGSYNAAADLLSDARAERRALLRALDAAAGAQEIATLRERLRGVRARIASRTSSLDAVRRRAAFATISVDLQGRRAAVVPPPSGRSWTPGDALHDAGRVLEVVTGVAILAAAALLPAAALAALALGSSRVLRRRRREVALDRS